MFRSNPMKFSFFSSNPMKFSFNPIEFSFNPMEFSFNPMKFTFNPMKFSQSCLLTQQVSCVDPMKFRKIIQPNDILATDRPTQ